jgi:UDP:flavonoid glycosyltransferase YjiC (YdhE family)
MTEDIKIGPLVSVVISTHDQVILPASGVTMGSMLASSIASVITQAYPNWELWVVSDHPPDPVRRAIENLAASFHDERIHYEDLDEDLTRRSTSAIPGFDSKRRGAERSRGTLLTFLDPGCTFDREHLYRSVDIFESSIPALDLVYCDSRLVFTGKPDQEDLLQTLVASPYNVWSRFLGQELSGSLKEQLSSIYPMAPLAGMPYVYTKPGWDKAAVKRLEQYSFIDLSDAVMTREAYEAAGGLRKLSPLGGSLWRNMIRAGRSRFRHVPYVGVQYSVADLATFRRRYAVSVAEKMNLPVPIDPLGKVFEDRGPRSDRPKNQNAPLQHAPRILFVGEATALSHIVRPSVFAAYLQATGYDVCIARDPRFSNLLDERELAVIDLKSLSAAVVETRLARHEPVHDADTLDRYVQEDLRIIREFKPDVVVGDQRHSLAISSRLERVPYVNIADGHWSPAVDIEYELPNSPISGAMGVPISNLLFQFARPLAFAYHALPVNVVRIRYGLPPISPDIRVCNTYGDYTVFPNDPELFRLKEPLSPRQNFIGPVLWSPRVSAPEWWDRVPENRSIVYVSLGSTGQANLLDPLLNALSDLPVTAIVATAGRWRSPIVPGNIFIADFLPGAEAVSRSRLAICNGGTMSGQQALSAGIPYLGLISNLDQMMFSTLVRRASACEFIREGDVNGPSLRSLILKLLSEDKYRTAARKIAVRSAKMDSCKKFESVISSILLGRMKENNAHRVRTA